MDWYGLVRVSGEVSLEASTNLRQSVKTRVESTRCRSQPTGDAALARGNPPLGLACTRPAP
eukprot:4868737-Lingulodinium_polyedra.AAC.1